MAYTKFRYDVFVSYAHDDNIPDAAGKGWVEHLCDALNRLLPRKLRGEAPVLFFDRHTTGPNSQLDRLLNAARNSAVFLAVTSDSYARREWTQRELKEFVEGNDWNDGDETRLCAVECDEPEDRSVFPRSLDRHIGMKFWRKPGSTVIPLQPGDRDYTENLFILADNIAKKLRAMREEAGREEAGREEVGREGVRGPAAGRPGAEAGGQAGRRSVLLAQTTDDLEDEARDVRHHLAQFRITVLPAEEYPQGGQEFRDAFAADLARADFFVQLLSQVPGKRPKFLPEGYVQFQAAAAGAKQGLRIMQWRSPQLQPEPAREDPKPGAADEDSVRFRKRHEGLLFGPGVRAETLESFKAAVVREATRQPETVAPAPSASRRVFIDASREDKQAALCILDELARESFDAALPRPLLFEKAKAAEIRKDFERQVLMCDVVAFVYGEAKAEWLRDHLEWYEKTRRTRASETPSRILEIWVEPPDVKEEYGMRLSQMRRVHVRPKDQGGLRPLIEALAG